MDQHYVRISQDLERWIKEVGGPKRAAWLLGQYKGREPVDKDRWQAMMDQLSKFGTPGANTGVPADREPKPEQGMQMSWHTKKKDKETSEAGLAPYMPGSPKDIREVKKGNVLFPDDEDSPGFKGKKKPKKERPGHIKLVKDAEGNFAKDAEGNYIVEKKEKKGMSMSWHREEPIVRAIALPEERQGFRGGAQDLPGQESTPSPRGMPQPRPGQPAPTPTAGALPGETPPVPTEQAPEPPSQEFKPEEVEMALVLKRAGFNHTQFIRALYNLGVITATAEALWSKVTEGSAEPENARQPSSGAGIPGGPPLPKRERMGLPGSAPKRPGFTEDEEEEEEPKRKFGPR